MSQPPRRALAAALTAVLVLGWLALAPLARGWFWGSDDWLHLEHARRFAQGHVLDSFAARLRDYRGTGQAALRQVSTALWGLDFLLFGARASAYYATNIAVHLLNAALACLLVFRLGRSAFAGMICGLLYLLNARTTEVVWFLAVRSEALALTFSLLAVLAWPRARRSWGGRGLVGGLFTLALFSKATAASLPLVLVAHDLSTLPRARWLRPSRLLRDYAPVVAALGLYALAVGTLLDLRTTMGYVPPARSPFAQEAMTILRLARDVLLTPHWMASYGPVSVPPAARVRGGALLLLLGAGLLAGRGPRALWALGAAWTVGGLVLPWGLLARGMVYGRYFLPSTLGTGLLTAAALISLQRWRGLRGPGRAAAAGVVVASALAFHQPDALRFHADLGRGVESAVGALAAGAAKEGPMRDLYVVLPSTTRGLLELVQRDGALGILLPSGIPRQTFVLGEGNRGLRTQRPPHEGGRQGVPHCGDLLPLRWDFELGEVDTGAGDRVLYEAASPAGGTAKTATFALLDDPPPRPAPGPFPGPTLQLWDLRSPRGAADWSYASFAGQRGPGELPHGTERGVELRVPVRTAAQTLQRSLLNHQPPVVLSPPLDRPTSSVCELDIDLIVTPLGPDPHPFSCALEPAAFALLFWSDSPDAIDRRHMVLPLRADGRPESLRVDLRNSPPWLVADRVRRLALLPASVPADVTLQRVELIGCGFGEGG